MESAKRRLEIYRKVTFTNLPTPWEWNQFTKKMSRKLTPSTQHTIRVAAGRYDLFADLGISFSSYKHFFFFAN